MHERSLVRALLRQVEALVAEHAAQRVVAIRVRLGEFSGCEAELLHNAFDELAERTAICGALLEVDRVPLEATCQHCGTRFAIEDFRFECAHCGSLQLNISGGEELLLESVTIEGESYE